MIFAKRNIARHFVRGKKARSAGPGSHFFECHHLISMVSELHRERQDRISDRLTEYTHTELALELGIEFPFSHFFGADPGVLFILFLSHHLYVVEIEGIQAADDLEAVAGVSDGAAGCCLVDRHGGYAGSTTEGILENLRLLVSQLAGADPYADPVFCLCFNSLNHLDHLKGNDKLNIIIIANERQN